MRNRHERRKAAATSTKKVARLNTATFDQHFDGVLRNVRAVFERTGEVRPGFECLADGESFHIAANWLDRSDKAAAFSALRECFRRRGVKRYVFVTEVWMGNTPGLSPTDDPARGEWVEVIAVERNGPRRAAAAEIIRHGETATLGPWNVALDQKGWLVELLEEGHSDRAPKEEPPLPKLTAQNLESLMYKGPTSETVEIYDQLGDLLVDQMNNDPPGTFLALESVLRSIVQDLESPNRICEFARFLKDHPDKFPMFSTVWDSVPSIEHVRRCKATLQHFIEEKRKAGCTDSVLIGAFINRYMHLGSHLIGALKLAERIEAWDPEYWAKLRQVGLRSSYELDDEEGHCFVALSADRYPMGVMGRRNAVGDLFVCEVVACPQGDFATAVDKIKQEGFEVITGAEARELFCKLERVKGFP
jgi:hypothetical protein